MLRSDNKALARDCEREMKDVNDQIAKLKPYERATRRTLYGELKKLRGEARKRQEHAVDEVLSGAQVGFQQFIPSASCASYSW